MSICSLKHIHLTHSADPFFWRRVIIQKTHYRILFCALDSLHHLPIPFFFVFPFSNHHPATTQKFPPVSMCLYNPHWIPSIPSSQVSTLRLVRSTPLGYCNSPLLPSLFAANRSHRWQLSWRPPWRASEVVEVATCSKGSLNEGLESCVPFELKPVYLKKHTPEVVFDTSKRSEGTFLFWLVPCFQNASEKAGAWKIWCKSVKSSMDSNVSHAPKTSCFGFLVGHPCFLVLKGKNTPRRFGKKRLRIQNGWKNRWGK